MLSKFKEKALKSFPQAKDEEEALSLLLQMYERHDAERLDVMALNASQATQIARLTKGRE